jgi:hypothetical protein
VDRGWQERRRRFIRSTASKSATISGCWSTGRFSEGAWRGDRTEVEVGVEIGRPRRCVSGRFSRSLGVEDRTAAVSAVRIRTLTPSQRSATPSRAARRRVMIEGADLSSRPGIIDTPLPSPGLVLRADALPRTRRGRSPRDASANAEPTSLSALACLRQPGLSADRLTSPGLAPTSPTLASRSADGRRGSSV